MDSKKQSKFSELFDRHYEKLYNYSVKVLKNEDYSRDIVQEVFIKLWENIDRIEDNQRSIESFLIITLKNKIIDHLRKENVKKKHIDLYALNKNFETEINNDWELSKVIEKIYEMLPDKTLDMFQLSRYESLTYKEIAEKRKVSVKTVESHISKALLVFRKELKKYL